MSHSTLWKATSSVARNCQQSKNPVPIQRCKKMVWSAKTRCEFFSYKKIVKCLNLLLYIIWQYRLWNFTFGYTKSNRLLPKSEVFQRILWFILKWNNGEPTKFGPIFTKLTFLSWVQFFRSHLIIFSPDIYIVTLVDTHMYLQPCTFYDSQGTEALPSFWTFQRGIHSRTLACLNGDGKW